MSAYRLQLTSESASSVSRRLLALAAEAQEHLAANYRSIAYLTVPASLRAQRVVEFHPPKSREQSALLLQPRSEEHTSELQSRGHLVCRLLLEKKNKITKPHHSTVDTISHHLT